VSRYYTFDEFGWSAGLSPASQRSAVQSALDSGERLLAPVHDPVEIDDTPLDMNVTTTLIGNGNSKIRCAAPQTPILRVQSEHTTVENVQLIGTNTARTAAAIIVGPQNGDHARYCTIDRVWTYGTHGIGIQVKATGGLTIKGGMVEGTSCGIRWENTVSCDTGDNKIIGVDINAGNTGGAGLWWTSGGGLYVQQCKFVQGINHVRINNSTGSTGSLMFTGNSFEGNTPISVDMVGNTWFNRMHFVGNSFGVLGAAIVVRNYVTSGNTHPWLGGLLIQGNTIQAGQNGAPCMDIGCAKEPLIGANHIQGNGTAAAAIIVRPECHGGKFESTGSVITGCLTTIQNYGTGALAV
jgi:hypothetical protein